MVVASSFDDAGIGREGDAVVPSPQGRAAPSPPPDTGPPIGLRLHHKGVLVLLALAGLIALLIGLVLAYRSSMEQDFDRLEQARRAGVQSGQLAQTQALLLGELGAQLGGAADAAVDIGPIERLVDQLAAKLGALSDQGVEESINLAALELARSNLTRRPDRTSLLALRAQVQSGVDALARQSHSREALAAAQVSRVHERGRAVAVALAAVAVLGTALIGVVLVFFFARLSADIGRLRTRALAVVGGDRRAARTIERDDELGELGTAIDLTVEALAARERDLEIERRNVFHQEKLATIGAVAAGVLNDIGNPIAAIDGFARAMRDERDAGGLHFDNALCDPDHILQQTERLQSITRQIAQLAAPPSSQPQWLSLNETVRTAVMLANFDARLAGVAIETRLDPQLPAVEGVAEQLVQLVLNLLVNAADATRGQAARSPAIAVTTRAGAAQVTLSIADNGGGMDEFTLAHAFDPLFTTKPAGQGTGLGLPLCRDIAQQHHGSLTIESTPGAGSTATLVLSLTGSGR